MEGSCVQIETVGDGLNRAECVLAHESGAFICSDATGSGGVAVITPDGDVRRILSNGPSLHPNGIAVMPDGTCLIAHLGAEYGGVYRLYPDGSVEPFLTELDGEPLPPTNFVRLDDVGRVWITVSTRLRPRDRAYRPDILDGYVICVDDQGARVVTDNLGYTNECVIDGDRGLFYINETFNRRITRYRLAADGTLKDRLILAEFGRGTFPDGLTLDEEGGLWMTSVINNALFHIDPKGGVERFMCNGHESIIDEAEKAFAANSLTVQHIASASTFGWNNLSSLAFCGNDLQDAVLGSLGGSQLLKIRMPVRGQKLPHWDFALEALLQP
jgi:SMP-30/Gluconolactonase/LRE-like region